MAIFCNIARTFLGRNTTSNKSLDARSKETITKSYVTRLLKSIIMNFEQLIFTWKGRQFVLALFASLRPVFRGTKIKVCYKYKVTNITVRRSCQRRT